MFGIKEVVKEIFDVDSIKPGHAYEFSFYNDFNSNYDEIITFIGLVINVDEESITYVVLDDDILDACIISDIGVYINPVIDGVSVYRTYASSLTRYHFRIKELQSTNPE